MKDLTWDGNRQRYYAEIDEGTLFVSGDDFAEARHETTIGYLQDSHPDASKEELEALLETDEGDEADTKAWEDMIDVDTWLTHAEWFTSENQEWPRYHIAAWVIEREGSNA